MQQYIKGKKLTRRRFGGPIQLSNGVYSTQFQKKVYAIHGPVGTASF